MASGVNGGAKPPGVSLDARHYSALITLLIVVIDYLACLKAEHRCIWRPPLTKIRLLYMLARYCSLASLLAHYVLIHRILLSSSGHVGSTHCKDWFAFLEIACAVLCAILNIILVLRAYALYKKNMKILAISIPLVGQFVGAMVISIGSFIVGSKGRPGDSPLIWGIGRTWRRQFTPMCDLVDVPMEVIYIGPAIVIAQALLWILTILRRNVAHSEGGSRVVRLVVREGTCVCALLCAIIVALIPYSVIGRLTNPFVIFVWPICVVSITACRLVLNMQELDFEPPEDNVWEELTMISSHESSDAGSHNEMEDGTEHRQQTEPA